MEAATAAGGGTEATGGMCGGCDSGVTLRSDAVSDWSSTGPGVARIRGSWRFMGGFVGKAWKEREKISVTSNPNICRLSYGLVYLTNRRSSFEAWDFENLISDWNEPTL